MAESDKLRDDPLLGETEFPKMTNRKQYQLALAPFGSYFFLPKGRSRS